LRDREPPRAVERAALRRGADLRPAFRMLLPFVAPPRPVRFAAPLRPAWRDPAVPRADALLRG
jgi:hypothetical protein